MGIRGRAIGSLLCGAALLSGLGCGPSYFACGASDYTGADAAVIRVDGEDGNTSACVRYIDGTALTKIGKPDKPVECPDGYVRVRPGHHRLDVLIQQLEFVETVGFGVAPVTWTPESSTALKSLTVQVEPGKAYELEVSNFGGTADQATARLVEKTTR